MCQMHRWRWLPWGYGASPAADGDATGSKSSATEQAGRSAASNGVGSHAGGNVDQRAAQRSRQAEAEAEAALLRAVGVVRIQFLQSTPAHVCTELLAVLNSHAIA